jgi:4-amino-4-deoxy-L-arabinose transferase-like glycosyltransferase
VPGPKTLEPVRRTMAVVGALSVALLFLVGRLVGGTLAGAVAALCATFSPLLQIYFVQARTEALLACFSSLALLGTLLTARRFQREGHIPRLGWLVGLVLGLALATKLTAALAIVGVCGYGGAAALARWRPSRPDAIRLLAWTLATGALASTVWVVVNPFLWPDPVGRTWSMLEQQQSIMVEQGVQFGNPVEADLLGRVGLLVHRTFVETSTPAFDAGRPPGSEPLVGPAFFGLPAPLGVSAELVLATIGLAVLVARAVAVWRADRRHGPEVALLWWLAAYAFGIAANLSLDWPRYYVPTAFFGALLIGLGVARVAPLAQTAWVERMGLSRPAAERPAGVDG